MAVWSDQLPAGWKLRPDFQPAQIFNMSMRIIVATHTGSVKTSALIVFFYHTPQASFSQHQLVPSFQKSSNFVTFAPWIDTFQLLYLDYFLCLYDVSNVRYGGCVSLLPPHDLMICLFAE